MNNVVFLGGSLTRVSHASLIDPSYPSETFSVLVQRRNLTETNWNAATTMLVIQPDLVNGQFGVAIQLSHAGEYRLVAIKNGAILYHSGQELAVPVGTITAQNLTVSTGVSTVTWGMPERVQIPITVAKTNALGSSEFINNPSTLSVSFTYNDSVAYHTTGYSPVVNGNTITYSVDKPIGSAATGAITARVSTDNGNWFGTASIAVNAREAFNVTVTPSVANSGMPISIGVQQFDAAGRIAGAPGSPYAYTVTTYSGPIKEKIAPVVRINAAHNNVVVTPNNAGVITVTVVAYDVNHIKIAEAIREILVVGVRVELGVTSAHVGDIVRLRATVTDNNGNRINNALVSFIGTPRAGGSPMFITKDALSGVFPVQGNTTNTVEINGFATNLGQGSSINNGEYSVDVKLNEIGTISVRVATPSLLGNQLIWTEQALLPQAIIVEGILGYRMAASKQSLVAGLPETIDITVRDTNGVGVTANLMWESSSPDLFLGGGTHLGNGVYRVSIAPTKAATYKIRTTNSTTRMMGTLDIAVLAPVVTVTPTSGLAASFPSEITVIITDPRDNSPLSMSIRIEATTVAAPNSVMLPTVTFGTRRNRAIAATTWTPYSINGVTAAAQVFEITAYPTDVVARTIAGVVYAPRVSIVVGNGAAVKELNLQDITVEVSPSELYLDQNNTITVRVLDAHGKPMTGHKLSFSGMGVFIPVTEIPATGELSVVLKPTASGIITGNVEISVIPNGSNVAVVTKKVPVVSAPADMLPPTIEFTAPKTTANSTTSVIITVKDNVAIAKDGIIFDGVPIIMFPTKTHTFVRNVNLSMGVNTFVVMAMDSTGNVTSELIQIQRGTTSTPTTPTTTVITIGKTNPAIGLTVAATTRNGRLMVPFRWFGETILGASVDYRVEGAAEIVTLVKGNTRAELVLNTIVAKVNGTPTALDVAPYAISGRTLVPARFLAEAFGYTVSWDPATDNVTITKK